MKTWTILPGLILLTVGVVASAENLIEEWGHEPGIEYEIHQINRTVLIKGPGTYKFQATDDSQPGEIQWIHVQENVAGTVYLYVAHESGGFGAQNLREVNLSGADGSQIWEINLAGDLGELGPTVATSINGPLVIEGDVLGDIEVQELVGDITCRSLGNLWALGPSILGYTHTGSVTVWSSFANQMYIGGSMAGNLYFDGDMAGLMEVTDDLRGWLRVIGDLSGDLSVGGNLENVDIYGLLGVPGTISVGRNAAHLWIVTGLDGRIQISKDLVGWLSIGNLNESGLVEIGGDLIAMFTITGWNAGTVIVDGGLTGLFETRAEGMPGDLVVLGNVSGQVGVGLYFHNPLTGTIRVEGDLSGTVTIPGMVQDEGEDLSGGHIIVNGSLRSTGAIDVGGFAGSTEFIAIDYDGWDPDDTWEAGATVTVDGQEYTENTPAARVWEISRCRGDLNNDHALNAGDIPVFVLALTNPAQYALAYPGLDASRVYHGDCNGDESFNAGDIPYFVDLIVNACGCVTSYEECFGDGPAGGGPSPEEVAALLAHSIGPELRDPLLSLIEELIDGLGDGEQATFWSEVLDLLMADG